MGHNRRCGKPGPLISYLQSPGRWILPRPPFREAPAFLFWPRSQVFCLHRLQLAGGTTMPAWRAQPRVGSGSSSVRPSWEGGRKRRAARRGGNNEGLRPSQAHGSGGTSVRPASGQQLHAAQRVGAESRSQNSEPRYRSGGGSPGWHLQTVFFFPLSLRLCADSHVGGLIKPHVPPDGSLARRRRPAGGAAASLMSPPTRWGSGPGEDWG